MSGVQGMIFQWQQQFGDTNLCSLKKTVFLWEDTLKDSSLVLTDKLNGFKPQATLFFILIKILVY